MTRARVSAGLLMFRSREGELQVLLVHPGGPYFRAKDEGWWTIPKGEVQTGEDRLTRARLEFQEELGIGAESEEWLPLGEVKQKGGKVVQAWAFAGEVAEGFTPRSNSFELEWPPRSGRRASFPEIDSAEFFGLEEARVKINAAQIPFLDRLVAARPSHQE